MEETEKQVNTETITASESVKSEIKFDDFLNFSDLVKSEQELKGEQKLQGLKDVEPTSQFQDRTFARKEDEHKAAIKKRVKLVTGIYIAVVTLLLAFVGVNLGTMISLNKKIDEGVKITQSQQNEVILNKAQDVPDSEITGEDISITLNQPRDYNDDDQSLNMLDKLTILFRSLFN